MTQKDKDIYELRGATKMLEILWYNCYYALGKDTAKRLKYETITLYRWFQAQGNRMIIWSGGGVGYAEMWANKLGLFPCEIRIKEKTDDIDIAFDDCDVDLAKVNIKVKRLNNNRSREQWNKHK